jgi:hypothetical protein
MNSPNAVYAAFFPELQAKQRSDGCAVLWEKGYSW